MKMQYTVTSTLESTMKHPDAYLFTLAITLLLAVPLVRAVQTLLAMHARVIVPLFRTSAGQPCTTTLRSVRRVDASICPHCASFFEHTNDSNPTTFTQPREAL